MRDVLRVLRRYLWFWLVPLILLVLLFLLLMAITETDQETPFRYPLY